MAHGFECFSSLRWAVCLSSLKGNAAHILGESPSLVNSLICIHFKVYLNSHANLIPVQERSCFLRHPFEDEKATLFCFHSWVNQVSERLPDHFISCIKLAASQLKLASLCSSHMGLVSGLPRGISHWAPALILVSSLFVMGT